MNPTSTQDSRLAKRKDWAEGVVRTSGRGGTIILAIFAVFWSAIAFTVASVTLLSEGEKPPMVYIVLLFPLVGVLLLWAAIHSWMSHRRWGESVLRLTRFPPRLGGVMRGTVEVSRPIDAVDSVRTQVRCVRITRKRSGNKTTTSRETLWETESFVDSTAPGLRQGKIEVAFRLPTDQPTAGSASIEWELNVTAKTPGPDYRARFDLPVLEMRPGDDDDHGALPPLIPSSVKPPTLERVLAEYEPTILLSEIAGSTRFEIPAWRHKGFGLVFAFIGLLLLGGVVACWVFGAPIFISIILLLIGLLFAYVGLSATLTSRKISVARSAIEAESSFLVFPRHRLVTPEQISEIDAKMTGSAGDTSYYDITLRTVHGQRIKLAHMIRGQPAAQGMVDRINAALGRMPG